MSHSQLSVLSNNNWQENVGSLLSPWSAKSHFSFKGTLYPAVLNRTRHTVLNEWNSPLKNVRQLHKDLWANERILAAAAAAKSLQSCPTLCDSIDSSPPGSPVPGILQARTPEWVAISFSNAWKWKVKVKLLSRVWLFETPWTAAYQALLSMGFSRQEHWSGVQLPSQTL